MPAGNDWFHFLAKYKIRPTADQFNAERFGRVRSMTTSEASSWVGILAEKTRDGKGKRLPIS
jgi:hypothetical protein